MNTQADKTQEKKSQSVANAVAQKQSGRESTFQFVDNRAEAVAQRKLQKMANNYSAQKQKEIIRGKEEYEDHIKGFVRSKPTVQLMRFNRFSGFFGTFNFSSYTEQEKTINSLESDAVKKYNRIHDRVLNNPVFAGRIAKLNSELHKVREDKCDTPEYDAVEATLRRIIAESETIFQEYTEKRDFLANNLADNLEVVDDLVAEGERGENQVTAKELTSIKRILNKIYLSNTSIISIELEMGETFDLARRSGDLEEDVPAGLGAVEENIRDLTQQKEQEQEELIEQRLALNVDDPERAEIRKRQDSLWEDPALLHLKDKYKTLVNGYVRDQTLLDLIKIAQTKVGREMLTEMATRKYEENAKVVIGVRDTYVAATGGPSKSGGAKVTYAPQAIRDRDTVNRAEGGAIPRLAELAEDNPWQENNRSDITLFHELVHSKHTQDKTDIDKSELVSNEDAVHPADRRFEGADQSEKGVPKEEYFTVGLGEYEDARFTENKYRAARIALGEEVEPRTQYTHVNEDNERVGDEIAM